MTTPFRCDVCHAVNGAFREHCHVCGASRVSVFWLYDGPNTWRKEHIDVDRPIHRATSSMRDIRVNSNARGLDLFGVVGMTVVDDAWLLSARELSADDLAQTRGCIVRE